MRCNCSKFTLRSNDATTTTLLVYVLHKTRNKAFPRRSRVKTVKKCTKKVWCTCKVVVLLIKPIVFLPSRCRPRRWILKSLISEPIERWISYDRLFSASFLGRSVTWRKHPVTHYKFRENFAAKKNLERTRSSKIIMMIIKKKFPVEY